MSERFDTIILDAGETFDNTWTWNDVDGLPVPMNGATAMAMFRADPNSEDPSLTLLSGSGITLGADDGTIRVVIASDETTTLSEEFTNGRGLWDLRVTFATGTNRFPIGGVIRIRRAMTR